MVEATPSTICRCQIVKNRIVFCALQKTEALFGFEYPAQITLSITRDFSTNFFLAAVSDVPDVAG
jgi:hypothetical protein